MHVRALLLSFLLLASVGGKAQEPTGPSGTEEKKMKVISKPSRDFLMFQITYEGWAGKPDSIKSSGFNRGFNAYLCYDFPISKSHFSFAAGVGVGTANIYFQDQRVSVSDTGAAASQIRFLPEDYDYKRFKLTSAYLEAPFELRYFGNKENRNKGFKAAIGLRVGTLINAHTKGRRSVDGAKLVEKDNTRRYFETYRFAGTVRLGFGNFTLLGTYNINTLFKTGLGPEITPYSIGLCITGL
jgi:hypothetical protein